MAPNPILILILVLGGLESWRRWQERRRPGGARRTTASRRAQRVIAGVAYIALAVALALAMSATFVERDI